MSEGYRRNYARPVTLLASVRLVRHLNALGDTITDDAGVTRAAAAVVGSDVAHHVVDPDGIGGLDPIRATALADALPALADRERRGWVLVLPAPGRLGGLRGPVPLNQAALAAGSAVVGLAGGLALVPTAVGPAVQWRVFRAEPSSPTLSSYEAERALSETILEAGRTLARLDVAAGPGPRDTPDDDLGPAPGYPPRRRAAAERAARLLLACEHALSSDGASLSSYEMASRRRELENVRDAARDALVAAVSWQDARV